MTHVTQPPDSIGPFFPFPSDPSQVKAFLVIGYRDEICGRPFMTKSALAPSHPSLFRPKVASTNDQEAKAPPRSTPPGGHPIVRVSIDALAKTHFLDLS